MSNQLNVRDASSIRDGLLLSGEARGIGLCVAVLVLGAWRVVIVVLLVSRRVVVVLVVRHRSRQVIAALSHGRSRQRSRGVGGVHEAIVLIAVVA